MQGLVGSLGRAVSAARVFAVSGLLSPVRPDRLLGMALALGRWGVSPATAVAAGAARDPGRVAVVDDAGPVTYAEIDRCSNAVAAGLLELGLAERDAVALMARNSRQFLIAQAAVGKIGGDLVYLNTGFGARQIADVVRDEDIRAVIADEEFADVVADGAPKLPRVLAWVDGERSDVPTLDGLAAGPHRPPRSPGHASRHVILTSGTTGKPKGAPREAPGLLEGIEPLVALVGAIPLRARQATVLATPMFHTWGFAHLLLGLALQSTLVVQRRFEPEATLALLEQHEATAMIAVPVMLQRMLALPDEVRARHRPRALRVVAISGSAIPASVAERFMDEFGDVVYNLYGSTEVAYATVATPADLRAAPGTAGRPVHGVTLRILGDDDRELPQGETGRIFAGNALTFHGYSGGEDKERVGGLVATGDVGHLDGAGRLMIDGRDDDMIVSGGENVYPREVEECLLGHPGVADAAVVGVPDERYGQALVAHVVARNGGVDPEELRGYVKRELAGYKVPREVVLHDDLPRNETGKVLKTELSD
jgi:acyl-CoA synthetase (AMP-forming)/AMP-acid ligase II